MRKREKPQSAYSIVYDVISKEYVKNKYKPLAKERLQEILESTPELCLPAGTTMEEIMEKLSRWKLAITGRVFGLEGEVIIPLAQER
jgi:hypothetical protein